MYGEPFGWDRNLVESEKNSSKLGKKTEFVHIPSKIQYVKFNCYDAKQLCDGHRNAHVPFFVWIEVVHPNCSLLKIELINGNSSKRASDKISCSDFLTRQSVQGNTLYITVEIR